MKDWALKLDDALWAYKWLLKLRLAIKKLNFDLQIVGKHKLLQLNEMEEFQNQAYENSKIYKECTVKWHDNRIVPRAFLPGKLKSRWFGPFVIKDVTPYGAVELHGKDGTKFKENLENLENFENELILVRKNAETD
ncbi:uncharacterized protein LOC120075519 [Benincasa hispida]|uniref:uncharacterized protein LOC120075519 n=1 Tax=Benincasa hispida TaxID=102211 RepID=UPI0019024593|nr:uncharacterized protein LOC120075519 [Benincasa hispida]